MFMFYQSEVFPHVQVNVEKSQYSPVKKKNKMRTNKQIKERTQTRTNQKPTSLVHVHRSGRETLWYLILNKDLGYGKNHSNISGPNSVTMYLSSDM